MMIVLANSDMATDEQDRESTKETGCCLRNEMRLLARIVTRRKLVETALRESNP
jgi:hypothetical protein